MTVGDFLLERLGEWGIRRIFGYPGDGINGLMGALNRAGDAFEFVELAVHPDAQGHGLGARLHDTLLVDVPYRTAVLSTYQGETAARQLYRRRGWVPLLEHFYYPGGAVPMAILGLDLPVRRARR